MRFITVTAALALTLVSPAFAAEPVAPAERSAAPAKAAIVSPRDAASGQATGKRQHKPIRFKLADGREAELDGNKLSLVARDRTSAAPAGKYLLAGGSFYITVGDGLVIEAQSGDGKTRKADAKGVSPEDLVGIAPLPSP